MPAAGRDGGPGLASPVASGARVQGSTASGVSGFVLPPVTQHAFLPERALTPHFSHETEPSLGQHQAHTPRQARNKTETETRAVNPQHTTHTTAHKQASLTFRAQVDAPAEHCQTERAGTALDEFGRGALRAFLCLLI
ncbi:uncharacterized protein SPSK_04647 [Sporothrix schenckii 1099-18]|uniref:Uncharacterized protein n=1 Tax=Sporothrix schenckii 1099-18 TaxID=1397361 RepID=A0A0F2M0S8_SPOSC|nr:uncharacterized protein SPSK_04647 [Sporothrix schenckii 1099-18]KJR83318.1 hypothetical protein SPSK_04647 [Sporothrix schenckii 1099-18]